MKRYLPFLSQKTYFSKIYEKSTEFPFDSSLFLYSFQEVSLIKKQRNSKKHRFEAVFLQNIHQ